jgi:hypothetical protein
MKKEKKERRKEGTKGRKEEVISKTPLARLAGEGPGVRAVGF